jgi:diphthine synthase
LDTIEENLVQGLHTLILLDIDTEKGRYLTIGEAASIMMETDKLQVFNGDTLMVGVARLGSDEPVIKAEKAIEFMEMDLGDPPHSIAIPGSLHFMEIEALKVIGGCPEDVLEKHHKPTGRLEHLIEKYLVSCNRALETLKLKSFPFVIGEAEVKDLITEAERYMKDAEYYAHERRATALASVCYSEGLLDALRLLGLVEFEW